MSSVGTKQFESKNEFGGQLSGQEKYEAVQQSFGKRVNRQDKKFHDQMDQMSFNPISLFNRNEYKTRMRPL